MDHIICGASGSQDQVLWTNSWVTAVMLMIRSDFLNYATVPANGTELRKTVAYDCSARDLGLSYLIGKISKQG